MPKRVSPHNEKLLPGLSFKLFIPVSFSISASKSLINEFNEMYDAGRRSKIMRLIFLNKLFNVKTEAELLKKYLQIRKQVKILKEEVKDESGLTPNEFSLYFREQLNTIIKKNENKE